MNLFQIIFVPVCIIFALHTALRLWYRRVPRRLGTLFMIGWVAAGFLIAEPGVTTVLARWLGIGQGSNVIMYLSILGGLFACYYFYDRYRRLEIILTKLVRRDAIDHAQEGERSKNGT